MIKIAEAKIKSPFVRLMPPVVVRLHGLRAATGCGQRILMNEPINVRDKIYYKVSNKVSDKVRDKVRNEVSDKVWDKVWDEVGGKVGGKVWREVRDEVWDEVD